MDYSWCWIMPQTFSRSFLAFLWSFFFSATLTFLSSSISSVSGPGIYTTNNICIYVFILVLFYFSISASTAHLGVQYNDEWCQTTSVLIHCSPNRDLCQRNMKNNQLNQLDVFHRRCLRSILGISWRDHVTNDEVMAQTGQAALHDTVATRRRRFVGHILRLPTTRPARLVWP